jgi:hypothetical protein
MSKITESQCQEFLRNPVVNPLTGRKIEKGKATYEKLMNECLKTIDAVPMGPMIHWRWNAENPMMEKKNIIKFYNFIEERYEKNKIDNLMECNEYIEILNYAKDFFDSKGENKKMVLKMIDKLKKLKTKEPIDNVPQYHVIVNMEVKPSRVFNRGQVLRCYDLYYSTKRDMLSSIKLRKITSRVFEGDIDNILSTKKYLDYLIEKKIFRYEDIYGKVFHNDKCFDELVKIFEEYKKFL